MLKIGVRYTGAYEIDIPFQLAALRPVGLRFKPNLQGGRIFADILREGGLSPIVMPLYFTDVPELGVSVRNTELSPLARCQLVIRKGGLNAQD